MPMVRLVFQPIDLCFTKYYFDILVASSRNIIPHCFPPIDSTGFLPERSTKALPCFLSDRHSVVVFTGALNPFAVEHPTHGSSFTPASSLTPCCLADSLNRRGGVWTVVRWYWLISTSVVGRSPGVITARACSMSSPSVLRPYEMYMSPTTGQSRSSPDCKCTVSP